MVDLLAAVSGNPFARQRLSDSPCEISKALHVGERQLAPVFVDQKEPVPSPGDIARYPAVAFQGDRHIRARAVTRHIADGDGAGLMQPGVHDAHGGVERMRAGLYPAQVGKRRDKSDAAVTAHAQIAHVVEKNHAGRTVEVARRAKQCADQCIRTARFVHHGGAKAVVLGPKVRQLFL